MQEVAAKSLRQKECTLSRLKSTLIFASIILLISAYGLFFYPTLTTALASPPESESKSQSESEYEPGTAQKSMSSGDYRVSYASQYQMSSTPKVPDNVKLSGLKPSGPTITEPPVSIPTAIVSSSTSPYSPSYKMAITGTVTSKDDPIQGTGLEQSYYIFSVNSNSSEKTYSGLITFTSSKPVQLQAINILTLNNTIKLPIQFGTLYTYPLNNSIIITSNLFDEPRVTGTAAFSGNSLRFIANEPFLLTYSFSGEQSESVVKNDIESGLEAYRKLIGPIS